MKIRKNKKGFTIVELVIVIGVIGILSAILIPTFVNVTKNAEDARLRSNLANAYSAYAAEAADGYVDETQDVIVFKSQEEVRLATSSSATTFYSYGANGWNLTPTAAPSGTKTTVAQNATEATAIAESTFGGFIVYYFA